MKTIAVDFDGVIHAYSRGWCDGEVYDPPVPGAFDSIRALMRFGFAVCVFSTRFPFQIVDFVKKHAPDLDPVALEQGQLFWNDNTRLGVTTRKIAAEVYIDDRAVEFRDWPSAMAAVFLRTGMLDAMRESVEKVVG